MHRCSALVAILLGSAALDDNYSWLLFLLFTAYTGQWNKRNQVISQAQLIHIMTISLLFSLHDDLSWFVCFTFIIGMAL